MPFTAIEYANMIYCWGVSKGNFAAALRLYNETYPNSQQPASPKVILRAVCRLRENLPIVPQTSLGDHRGGRKPEISPHLEERILRYFTRFPTASSRQAGRRFHVSHRTVQRILKRDDRRACHFQKVHDVSPPDYSQRTEYCRWVLQKHNQDPHFIHKIMWTGESSFSRNGTKNRHVRARTNSGVSHQNGHQYRWKINVWAAILDENLIGPVFINGKLTDQKYLDIVNNHVCGYLEDLPLAALQDTWYQYDEAEPHNTSTSRLNDLFGKKLIGPHGPRRWPPQSPDLTPMDYFLWEYIKGVVFESECETKEEMRSRIVLAFDQVREINRREELFKRVHEQNIKRLCVCLETNGTQVENQSL
ncbi:hypothetical protein EVAR_9376_1 [Eumeta japonica]|uniref:DUF4817 domain-containing protein n=1 Tax=Eumeta variegata TaxID=151549 RepID=A0A4C1UD29_EUMVA|nr:hypothetical protein EVAR_9376_1 [Eumeta japonica]